METSHFTSRSTASLWSFRHWYLSKMQNQTGTVESVSSLKRNRGKLDTVKCKRCRDDKVKVCTQ
jgi:hypothetical protein